MTPLKCSVLAAAAAVIVTTACFYVVHQRRAREIDRLQSRNTQLLFEANRRRTRVVATTAGAAMTAETPPAASRQPTTAAQGVENYRNEGQATPLATLQTLAWACDRGDTTAVAALICFDPAARTKAEAYLAGLPDGARAQWKSVDDLAAAQLTFQGMVRPFPSADVLATATAEPISAERMRLLMPSTLRSRTEYQKSGDTWKYVITEQMVDAFLAQARDMPLAPR